MRVVDTLKTNDEGELKAGFDFSPLKMAALMLFPTGNQLYWLIGSLYSVGFDLFSGSLVPKLLKFDFKEIVKQIKDIKVQMNEDQLSVTFDRYDSDNLGQLNRIQLRKFAQEVLIFGDGNRLSDELFEVIYGAIDDKGDENLLKSQVVVFFMNIYMGGYEFLVDELAMKIENSDENNHAIMKAKAE